MHNNVRVKALSLYSLTSARILHKTFAEDDVDFISSPECISPYDSTFFLGPADARFVANSVPTIVELLSIFPCVLDLDLTKVALQKCLTMFFPYCGGRRMAASNVITPGEGVRFSVVRVDEKKQLLARPPAACLFDPYCGYNGHVLTVRVVVALSSSGVSCPTTSIALSFDHALCDIAGAALILSCLSDIYCAGLDADMPAAIIHPHHDRAMQSSIVISDFTTTSPTTSSTPTSCHSKSSITKPSATAGGGVGGGSVCLQWEYDQPALRELKDATRSFSRHDAIFADVIGLLMATNNILRMETASVSKNERASVNLPGLPKNHFGNGTNTVSFSLPTESDVTTISSAIRRSLLGDSSGSSSSDCSGSSSGGISSGGGSGGGSSSSSSSSSGGSSGSSSCSGGSSGGGSSSGSRSGDSSSTSESCDRSRLSSSGSSSGSSSSGGGGGGSSIGGCYSSFDLNTNTDIHLNTWWHALQGSFFGTNDISFAIGPRTLASAGRMCSARGQPNLTVVPSCNGRAEDGLVSEGGGGRGVRVYLLAPLQAAHAVMKILRKRVREESSKARLSSSGSGSGSGSYQHILKSSTPLLKEPPDIHSAPSAALIWLHGLGDASDMWKSKMEAFVRSAGRRLPHVKCVFPRATERSVTCQGGDSHCSWFDIQSLPVSLSEPVDPAGLNETVAYIHSIIETLGGEGISPSRVIVGGFSQGGALAIVAGQTFLQPLCGIVSVSGWCVDRRQARKASSASSSSSSSSSSSIGTSTTTATTTNTTNTTTTTITCPSMHSSLFFSCGSGDPVIDYKLSKLSMEILQQYKGIIATAKTYQRAKHMPTLAEMTDIQNFISALLLDNS